MRAATAPSPDVAKPEALAQMTGREFMQALIDGKLPPPSIAETLSFRLVEVGDGYAVFEGETRPHLLNPLGTVHGGWVLTLIDSATGCAAHSMLPAGFGIEDQSQFHPSHLQGHRTRPHRGARRRPRAPNRHRRGARARFGRPRPGARDLDSHGGREQIRRRIARQIGVRAGGARHVHRT